MFCYQCEQTAKGTGCTYKGICGKEPSSSDLQDMLVYQAKAMALPAHEARELGEKDPELDAFLMDLLFTTVTNVNFDDERLRGVIVDAAQMRRHAENLYDEAARKAGVERKTFAFGEFADGVEDLSVEEILKRCEQIGIDQRMQELGDDVAGLQELVTYGLKGTAAYACHARILGQEDEAVYDFFWEALSTLAKNETDPDKLVGLSLKVGEVNLRVMELLDAANTGAYGDPEPTQVRIEPVKGKAILVSGHDLKDLAELLEQTKGKGINVYTHGEMLPALAYPELKKHEHLVGNYGGAWQDQAKEFDEFPGAILMTTNCIQRPVESYKDRIFTSGLVAWPGVQHVADGDFTPVIEAALAAPGFQEDGPDKKITIGFGRNAMLSAAPAVVEAVKSGAVRHFFLVGGCDGAKTGRNYYTEFAEKVPDDCVILTLACGKYRFNKMEFGDIGGIPRLLDCGQCNDAYTAIRTAVALAEAFDTDVNSLPLSLILSWYEQKAVCILLTLLHLGVQDMRLGPSLPAFVTPNILNVLVEKFGIKPIGTAEEDLRTILAA